MTQKYHLRGLAAYRWGRVVCAQKGRSDRANTGPSGEETSLVRCRLPKGVFTMGLADSTGGGDPPMTWRFTDRDQCISSSIRSGGSVYAHLKKGFMSLIEHARFSGER